LPSIDRGEVTGKNPEPPPFFLSEDDVLSGSTHVESRQISKQRYQRSRLSSDRIALFRKKSGSHDERSLADLKPIESKTLLKQDFTGRRRGTIDELFVAVLSQTFS
jgi:hypothetical protein